MIKKNKLKDIKIESFITEVGNESINTIRGGRFFLEEESGPSQRTNPRSDTGCPGGTSAKICGNQ